MGSCSMRVSLVIFGLDIVASMVGGDDHHAGIRDAGSVNGSKDALDGVISLSQRAQFLF